MPWLKVCGIKEDILGQYSVKGNKTALRICPLTLVLNFGAPMQASRSICLALAFLCVSPYAVAGNNTFESNFAIAKKNAETEKGAVYDAMLGTAMQQHPDFAPKFSHCLSSHPGHQAVRGYFYFTSSTKYRLVLKPESGFSVCLSKALEGRKVPAPPSVPYLNHFAFSTPR